MTPRPAPPRHAPRSTRARPPATAALCRAAAALSLAALCATASGADELGRPAGRFDVFEFVVEGNSVLSAEAVERAVYPFLGQDRSIDDVESARSALEKAYRGAGFGTVGVDIPEQQVDHGAVTLKVMQGEIARLRVTGARYFSQNRIIERLPALAEGRVPNLREAQEQLAAVNRTADRRVTPLLRPGRTPGSSEVDLQVEDRLPLHGSVELNNRASPNTSSTRLLASLRYDNLFQLDHAAGLQFQTSPGAPREVKLMSFTYTVPVGSEQWIFSFLRSDSEVAAGVGDTTVLGKGSIWGARRTLMLGTADKSFHMITLSADLKDFTETIDVGTGLGFATPVRYLPLGASYLGIVEDEAGRWQFGGGLSVALRGLASRDAQFADKRFGASSGFAVFRADLGREHKLPRGFTLAARGSLQIAPQPLISNEQFVAGGVDSVRGYFESAAAGDDGLRVSLEARTPGWSSERWAWASGLSALAFVDAASLKIRQPLPGQRASFQLAGVGVGLRAQPLNAGSLSLDLAWALRPLGSTQRGDLRLHASGVFEF